MPPDSVKLHLKSENVILKIFRGYDHGHGGGGRMQILSVFDERFLEALPLSSFAMFKVLQNEKFNQGAFFKSIKF